MTQALIIIPTYNEVNNLEPLLRAIVALSTAWDILVVDDNSPDGTGALAAQLARELPQVHVLRRTARLGYATAFVAGCRWALERDYEYIMSMDCDFSHHPRYLPTFTELACDAELVIGSRYVAGGSTLNWGLARRLISASGNLYARTMLGLQAHDCTSGFRCYHRKLIERIPWDSIGVRGYGFLIVALYHAQRLGARIVEFPIAFEDRRVGRSKMSVGIALEAFRAVTVLAGRALLGR